MSISSRITQIEQHLTDDYSVLELAGADLTNVDKNIQNLKQSWEERLLYFLANGTDVVWNNWLPKVTGSGETITLNNTIEAKMGFVYKGNTSQETTTGKNLLDTKVFENRLINCYVVNDNGSITQSATDTNFWQISYMPNSLVLNSGTYTISVNNRNGSKLQVYNLTTNSNIVEASVDSYTFTLNNDNQVINAKLYGGSSYPFTFTMQIEKGNQATSFEPYTNGASPSPDYPQDIQVVSGDNTIKVEGKNLFNKDNPNIIHKQPLQDGNIDTNSNYVATYLPAKEGDVFTISTTSNLFDNYAKIWFISENPATATTWLSRISRNSGETSITATAPQNTKYVCFYMIYSNNQTTINSLLETIQVEKSNEATTYEPYQSQTYPINLGDIELCKIGDYQDRIYKDNGKWYLNKQIGKVVLDGSENWGGFSIEPGGLGRSRVSVPNVLWLDTTTTIMANNLIGVYWSGSWNRTFDCITTYTNLIYVLLKNATDLESFKNIIANSNITAYYVLATPTITEITDTTLISQLEAIKKSYNTQTNISQTNADKPFILDVVALGELESI